MLLDVTMPRMNGFEVLKAIRRVSDVPVIMLTARGEDVDQVRGLELGADDYVAKPFSHLALMARIKAVLRRAELPPPVQALPDFQAGRPGDPLPESRGHARRRTGQADPGRVQAAVPPGAQRRASACRIRRCWTRVWGSDYEASPEYLKVFVSRLRAKLGARVGRSTSRPSAAAATASCGHCLLRLSRALRQQSQSIDVIACWTPVIGGLDRSSIRLADAARWAGAEHVIALSPTC